MNAQDTHMVFGWGTLVCVLGLILNLAMIKKRGTSAKLMAVAFLVFGAALLLVYRGVSLMTASPLIAVVLGLLFYDATLRLNKSGSSTVGQKNSQSKRVRKSGGR